MLPDHLADSTGWLVGAGHSFEHFSALLHLAPSA